LSVPKYHSEPLTKLNRKVKEPNNANLALKRNPKAFESGEGTFYMIIGALLFYFVRPDALVQAVQVMF